MGAIALAGLRHDPVPALRRVRMGSATMTSAADERALRLLARYGRAAAAPFRGYWICGGSRLAQATVRRLVDAGLARHEDRVTVVPTRAGQREPASDAEVGLDLSYEERWGSRRGAPADEPDDAETWAPPAYLDGDGDPVPVDEAMFKKEDAP